MKKTKRKDVGYIGEDLAIDYLEKRGYKIVERNFKCRFGEIDLIARIENRLVFVEVKLKKGEKYCKPIEAVDYAKQKKVIKSSLFYVQKYRIDNLDVQFDVVGIELEQGKTPNIIHIENAFEPSDLDIKGW